MGEGRGEGWLSSRGPAPVCFVSPLSFLIHPISVPKRLFMERTRYAQQFFSHHKKEKPDQQNAQRALAQPKRRGKNRPPRERHARDFFQARRAKHAVLVFRNAFAAEIPPALRATRRSLALGVVQTALKNESLHETGLVQDTADGGALESSTAADGAASAGLDVCAGAGAWAGVEPCAAAGLPPPSCRIRAVISSAVNCP